MRRLLLVLALIPAPALAQHDGHAMPMDHAMHGMAGMDGMEGTVPPAPADHAADAVFDRAAMARARALIGHENGGMATSLIRFDLAEYRIVAGRDGYRWDGEGRFGGDVDRLVVKSEGEGALGRRAGEFELQAYWSHAIHPNFDLQIGLRHDILPNPSRTYAAAGIEGVLPYWPELEATAFLSDEGDLTAEITAEYDMRITRRLILQPRIEATLAAQDVPAQGIAAGLSDIDLGLRLRYAIAPEFAPYVGIGWTRRLGDAADLARAVGDDPDRTALIFGVRAWF